LLPPGTSTGLASASGAAMLSDRTLGAPAMEAIIPRPARFPGSKFQTFRETKPGDSSTQASVISAGPQNVSSFQEIETKSPRTA
jgi:hypothetical protein